MNTPAKNTDVFFALIRGGLWEHPVSLGAYGPLDYDELLRLGEEQSVLGLVTAGLEQVWDVPVAKKDVVPLLQRVIAVENRNSAMNEFVASLFKRLQEAGIQAVLVKGQGIAQCYARPQWRAPGDVDLLLSAEVYERAKEYLLPLASSVEIENLVVRHLELTIDSWAVELHGTLHCGLSRRSDRMIDSVQEDTLLHGSVKTWKNGGIYVPVPDDDNNVIFIFTHILQHFFHGGIGLRQICDWCRLLWTSREGIDLNLLETRLREMKLMTEWKAFASLAVNWLGMPADAMPFYVDSRSYRRKADKILSIVLEKGNFGQNIDSSYMVKTPPLKRKLITVWRQLVETLTFIGLFPLDALRFLGFFFIEGFERTRSTTTFAAAKKKM